MYLEDPENTIQTLALDIPIYNPDTDSKCKTPSILAFAVEDSEFILAGGQYLLEGVELQLNTGEVSIVNNGVALFELENPLVFGQEIYVEVNTETCKTRSCSVFVSRISSYCIESAIDKPAGELTGKLRCIEKDLYREVYDGDNGVEVGPLVLENCIYCGGVMPNCLEPPTEPTTYYNIVRCSDGKIYQTTTVLSLANQRVSHPVHGLHRWNGTTQTETSSFIGEVTILDGIINCPSVPTTTYYNIVSCADGQVYQTTTPISINNQRVSHSTYGEHYWNNTTTTSPSANRGVVVIMTGIFGCG